MDFRNSVMVLWQTGASDILPFLRMLWFRMQAAVAKRFPGSKLVLEAANAKDMKNMLKTWLKSSEMEQVGLYFSVDDERELAEWLENYCVCPSAACPNPTCCDRCGA